MADGVTIQNGSRDRAATAAKIRRRDDYYIDIAKTVRGPKEGNDPGRDGANCTGSKVGAVLVLGNGPLGERVVATGYNGTPAGFDNCLEGGCVRCRLRLEGKVEGGTSLDQCVCVHAEQNVFLTAARFGISVEGATLYSTLSPCFGCLKESIQAGANRIVYDEEYKADYKPEIQEQYNKLVERLTGGNPINFEAVGSLPSGFDPVGQYPDPAHDGKS